MELIRKAILACDERIDECIKWRCPTFTYRGNIASFNPRATKRISLQFHRGAEIPGRFDHLVGQGRLGRTMTFDDAADVAAKLPELTKVVKAWIQHRDESVTEVST